MRTSSGLSPGRRQMWYASRMPETPPDKIVANAMAAVDQARAVRAYHRRRTEKGSPQRKTDIRVALAKLRAAMKPLKSALGKFPYQPQTEAAEEKRQAIRDASHAIQVERRKLWKLQ